MSKARLIFEDEWHHTIECIALKEYDMISILIDGGSTGVLLQKDIAIKLSKTIRTEIAKLNKEVSNGRG